MTKILNLSLLTLALSATSGIAFAHDGEALFNQNSCAACHNNGVAGAPIIGNKTDWAPRIAKGAPALYNSALKGIGAMPAKGGNAALSDGQVKLIVDYMISKSK